VESQQRWYRRRWARAGAAVLAAGLAAALAVPWLVPMDRFRPLVVQLLKGATGRDVRMDALRLYVLPSLHIHAQNVRVANPAGFPAGDALTVKALDVGVTLRGLWSRRIEVTRVALSGVKLTWLTAPGGRTNFDLAPAGRPAAGRGGATPGAPFIRAGTVGRITIRGLALASATVDARSGRIIPGFALSGLDADITGVDPAAAGWLRGLRLAAALKGVRLQVAELAKPIVFESGQLTVAHGAAAATFTATLDTLHVSGTVKLPTLDPPFATFTLQAPALDVDRVVRLMTREAGNAVAAPPGPRRLFARGAVTVGRLALAPFEATQVNGRLSVYSDRVRVDGYRLAAYGGIIEGTAAVDYAAAAAPATITARARALNIARVAAALAPGAPVAGNLDVGATITALLGRPQGPLVAGGGTFSAPGVTLLPVALTDLSGRFSLRGTRIRVDRYRFAAYGGVAQGAALLDYGAPGLPLSGTVRATGIDVGALARTLAPGTPRITGGLDGAFALATALGRDPIAALTGDGAFAIRNGSFPGLDLNNRLGGLTQLAQVLRLGAPSGSTRFRYFGGDLHLGGERGASRDLKLVADTLSGTAHGSFGFDRTLDYAGTAVIDTQASGGSPVGAAMSLAGKALGQAVPAAAGITGARVPFSVRGRFDSPQFALAGTPQVLRGQAGSPPAARPPGPLQIPQLPQVPGLPSNLLNLFH